MAAKSNVRGRSGNPARRNPVPQAQMTGEQQFQLARMKVRIVGHVVIGVILCAVILCTWPVAGQFAGKKTALNIAMSVSFVGVAAVFAAIGGMWGNHHRARANRLDARNQKLGRTVKILRQRLVDSGGNPDVAEDLDALLTDAK